MNLLGVVPRSCWFSCQDVRDRGGWGAERGRNCSGSCRRWCPSGG